MAQGMDALIISNVVLWVMVIILSLVVLALMRQIGVLHERVFPAGALMTPVGPKVGEAAPVATLKSISGGDVQVGGKNATGLATLLLFISPSCPVCKTLLPIVKSVLRAEKRTAQIVLASDAESSAEQQQHELLIQQYQLPAERYVLSRPLGLSFMVEKLPFAALIDSDGVLRAKGIVNSRELLESLFEAHARGVTSLQEHFSRAVHP
jgi:methylamine dehydrogenase accessory protein MauD